MQKRKKITKTVRLTIFVHQELYDTIYPVCQKESIKLSSLMEIGLNKKYREIKRKEKIQQKLNKNNLSEKEIKKGLTK